MTTVLPYVALVVSLVALLYAIRRFELKRGILIRGRWATTSSISCEDEYVSSVLLENLKDRAATIFGIYLRLGYNYYVEIEEFEDTPLILRPFEVYQKDYGPITYYDVSRRRIYLNDLLRDPNIRKRLFLATSQGKYRVRSGLSFWSPVFEFFRNHMTTVVRPVRSVYKEKAYGSNVRYLVEVKTKEGREEIIPIHPRDSQRRVFSDFVLTEESLQSTASLEAFLREKVASGELPCAELSVHDLKEWRDQAFKVDELPVVEAKRYGAIQYFVLGRILTSLHNRSLRQRNRARARAARASPGMEDR